MQNRVKIVSYGIGVLGMRIAKAALERTNLEIVGALDVDPDKVGKDLGDLLEIGKKLGIIVTNDPKQLFTEVQPDIIIHTTSSYLKDVYPQLEECIKAKLNVISTTEELSWPWDNEPDLARQLDELAKQHGVTVTGTGINPGYLMDTLPLVLTAPCLDVKSIKITRMMNSAHRRIPFQKKIGTGLTVDEFKQYVADKTITGHVGLVESGQMIAGGLGWKLDEIKEFPPEPVIAEADITTPYKTVKKGQVLGLKSIATAKKDGKTVITFEFIAYAGNDPEYDAVSIEGTPNIHERVEGGIHGDIGTIAMVLNTIPKVLKAAPGLKTMKDLPLPCAELG
ncbi:MAG: dihydrodipicolinate reductase [Candidatus Heimdallarchaeota archaeon]